MNRANQHALFQATNQGLLDIRQAEINYYINLNVAFGTQAALVGGFTYGIFTQNDFNEKDSYVARFKDIYWIFSAGTIASAVHVILSTMLLQVLGPGLALHGPVGSMIRACEGMREEQKTVVYAFALMMVMFSLSTLLLFWAVMTIQAAVGSTVVWLIAARYYYYYCERIYLRFYWKQEADYLHRDDDQDPSDAYADGPKVYTADRANPMHSNRSRSIAGAKDSTEDGVAMNDKPSGRFVPSMRNPFGAGKKEAASSPSKITNEVESTTDVSISSGSKEVVMQGFILMKRPTKNGKKRYSWKRYYFTLNGMGHFFWYKSRQEYREKPSAPKRKRPLNLSDFMVTVWNGEMVGGDAGSKMFFQFLLSPKDGDQSIQDIQEAMKSMMDSDTMSVTNDDDEDSDDTTVGGGTGKPSSSASSTRKWAMRCDTEEELDMWLEAMRDISPSSFSSN